MKFPLKNKLKRKIVVQTNWSELLCAGAPHGQWIDEWCEWHTVEANNDQNNHESSWNQLNFVFEREYLVSFVRNSYQYTIHKQFVEISHWEALEQSEPVSIEENDVLVLCSIFEAYFTFRIRLAVTRTNKHARSELNLFLKCGHTATRNFARRKHNIRNKLIESIMREALCCGKSNQFDRNLWWKIDWRNNLLR